jgi:type II secretory pathway predicted ATPase ExeA
LKELALDCGIGQADIARATGLSRATANLMLNRGYLPKSDPGAARAAVETMLRSDPRAMQWLIARNLRVEGVWDPLGKELRHATPAGTTEKSNATRRRPAMVPGDPEIMIHSMEVEMISQEAMQHFKLFRNPFSDDVQKESDIFMYDEHRYIEAAMLDAARHGGFLAVVGEVGSGKTVIRRKVIEQLRKDGNVLVIFPQTIDKTRVNAASICDAIIMDLSDQKPRIKLEAKARQVSQLLLERAKQGFRSVLIVEESHDLAINTLKYIKRFHELEDGYKKLLSVILVGQTELKNTLDERIHIEMREVIRRIQVAEIRGLNGNIKAYLQLKFKRIGAGKLEDIFTDEEIKMLSQRLTTKDKNGRTISHAYPLTVHNYVARAMNAAYEMGEAKVTEAVISAI